MSRTSPAPVILLLMVASVAVVSPRPPSSCPAPPVPTVKRVEVATGLTAVVYPEAAVVWIAGSEEPVAP